MILFSIDSYYHTFKKKRHYQINKIIQVKDKPEEI